MVLPGASWEEPEVFTRGAGMQECSDVSCSGRGGGSYWKEGPVVFPSGPCSM